MIKEQSIANHCVAIEECYMQQLFLSTCRNARNFDLPVANYVSSYICLFSMHAP